MPPLDITNRSSKACSDTQSEHKTFAIVTAPKMTLSPQVVASSCQPNVAREPCGSDLGRNSFAKLRKNRQQWRPRIRVADQSQGSKADFHACMHVDNRRRPIDLPDDGIKAF